MSKNVWLGITIKWRSDGMDRHDHYTGQWRFFIGKVLFIFFQLWIDSSDETSIWSDQQTDHRRVQYMFEAIDDVNRSCFSDRTPSKMTISMIYRLKNDSDRHHSTMRCHRCLPPPHHHKKKNTAWDGIMPVYLLVPSVSVRGLTRLVHILKKLEGKRSDHQRTTVNDMLSIIARRV